MNRFLAGCVVVSVSACGPIELESEASNPVAFTRQAGKTGQGKTGQGKTGQGSSATGAVFAVNRGGWTVRQSGSKPGLYTYPSGKADLTTFASTQRKTSQLAITTSLNTVYNVASQTQAVDQTTSPLATFLIQEINDSLTAVSAGREARIVNTWADDATNVNLLAPAYRAAFSGNAATPNTDIRLYKIQVRNPSTNAWEEFCQGEGSGGRAVFLPGAFTSTGNFITGSQQFISVACLDGTAAKCMRWGYRPWRDLNGQRLDTVWRACTRAAMADYCSNGQSYTAEGTRIDIWDRFGFITKSPETFGWIDAAGIPEAYSDESAFDEQGAVCLVRERLFTLDFTTAVCPMSTVHLSGNQTCTDPSSGNWSTCGPKGNVSTPTNVFDRHGTLTCDQAAGSRPPLVYVSSYDSGCNSHTPFQSGRALAVDCNSLTTMVCTQARPRCCAEDAEGHLLAGAWDSQCVSIATLMANGTWTPGEL